MKPLCSGVIIALLLQKHIHLISSERHPGCENCECCVGKGCTRTYVEAEKIYVDGYCTNGCVPGIYGNKCYNKCLKQCLTCDRLYGKECTSCTEEMYLSSGDCIHCNERCKSCTSATQCQECNPTYYNDGDVTDCSLSCPGNCLCEDEGICSSCQGGYYNIQNMCIDKCPAKCKTCSDKKTCQYCKDGYYKGLENNNHEVTDCSLSCRKNCSRCNSYNECTHCMYGMYGTYCQNTCSVGCSNGICAIGDGSCECKGGFTGPTCSACVTGLYGETCNKSCPTTCKDKRCARHTGHCYGCMYVNMTGDTCDQCISGNWDTKCSSNCPLRCYEGECIRESGFCKLCKIKFVGNICENCSSGYYGIECDDKCPMNCNESQCKRDTGICQSCKNRYAGPTCDDCEDGLYGPSCERGCSLGCANVSCDRKTGTCAGCLDDLSGDMCCIEGGHCETCSSNTYCEKCKEGFHGSNCDKTCPTSCAENRGRCERTSGNCLTAEKQGGTDLAPVAGGLAAAILVAAIVVVVVVVFRKRRSPNKQHDDLKEDNDHRIAQLPGTSSGRDSKTYYSTVKLKPVELEDDTDGLEDGDAMPRPAQRQDTVYENVASIYVSGLVAYVKKKSKEDYKQEFEQLPNGVTRSCKDARKEENVVKNRYKGVYPYDHSRVKIKGDPKFFLNACYIDGFQIPNGYIASSGPTKKATEMFYSFWKMVWHVNSEIIVMLTNLREPSGNKCDQYWPNINCTNTHKDITVSCRCIEVFAEYTVRTFTIEKKSRKRSVFQFHYTAWPDKSIPDEVTSLIELRQRVRSAPRVLQGPIIVHCSAGIGRTGTYIALDRLTETGEAGQRINVYECVYQMRQQRVNMVQTLEQYEFLHKALVHTLTFNCETMRAEDFESFLRDISERSLHQNFQLLKTVMDEESSEEIQARRTNGSHGDKNRKKSDIPGDRYRPRLYICRILNSSDYINAVYVNGFKKKNQYIIAQSPLPETVLDFICLIYQENCHCVVSLEDPDLIGTEIGDYLGTDNQALTCGSFTVKSSRCDSTRHFVLRKLIIKNADRHSSGERVVFHYQLNNWESTEKVPTDARQFAQCVQDVSTKASDMMNEQAPILVHCLNGAKRSGLFCAVGIILEKIEAEGQASIPNIVRQLRTRRKKAIPNKDQFQFCFCSVKAHLDLNNTYSNFLQ